jgi:hypothetical protein
VPRGIIFWIHAEVVKGDGYFENQKSIAAVFLFGHFITGFPAWSVHPGS